MLLVPKGRTVTPHTVQHDTQNKQAEFFWKLNWRNWNKQTQQTQFGTNKTVGSKVRCSAVIINKIKHKINSVRARLENVTNLCFKFVVKLIHYDLLHIRLFSVGAKVRGIVHNNNKCIAVKVKKCLPRIKALNLGWSLFLNSFSFVALKWEHLTASVWKCERLPLLFVCPSHIGRSRCPVWISFNVNLLSLSIRIQLNVRATLAALPCLLPCALPEWTSTGYGNTGSLIWIIRHRHLRYLCCRCI